MSKKGKKEVCPKGMAAEIVAKALTAHPTWNASQISEKYPVAKTTAYRFVKMYRDDPSLLECPKDYVDQKLEEQANSSITEGQIESNRLMFVAGTLFGVVLTMAFYLLNQAGI